MKLRLYVNTIRYLRVGQIFFQILERLRHAIARNGRSITIASVRDGSDSVKFSALITKPVELLSDGRFCFVNKVDSFSTWDDMSNGALWRYNLNYMDFLLQEGITTDLGLQWIDNFIRSSSANAIIDDPYPISLRCVNWIKFLMLHKVNLSEKSHIDSFVYAQLHWLYGHTEHHLLANHYFENGISLLWGGVYFRDDKMLEEAEKILCEQLGEQVLSDGCHFELSTMYHCVLLERVLDAVNLLINNDCNRVRLKKMLEEKASLMLGWLQAILLPDGNIPLLNDSAYGIAPFPEELFGYAASLGVNWHNTGLAPSGYRHLRKGTFDLIADVGQIGASYNAGHAHADTFNYVLWHDGRSIIVDSGTSCYAETARRGYERSTSAHNTVTLMGRNSSEVWSSFRCGRRAQVKILRDEDDVIEAEHDGYVNIGFAVGRSWRLAGDCLTVRDVVSHNCKGEAVSRIFLDPSLEVVRVSDCEFDAGILSFSFTGALNVKIEKAEVASRFNILTETNVLTAVFSKELCVIIKEK